MSLMNDIDMLNKAIIEHLNVGKHMLAAEYTLLHTAPNLQMGIDAVAMSLSYTSVLLEYAACLTIIPNPTPNLLAELLRSYISAPVNSYNEVVFNWLDNEYRG